MVTANGAGGSLIARLDELKRCNREAPSPEIEAQMVKLRHDAFVELADQRPGELPDVGEVQPASGPVSLDDLILEDRTGTGLRRQMLTYGMAVLPQAVGQSTVDELVDGIDKVFDVFDARREGVEPTVEDPERWYSSYNPEGFNSTNQRWFNRLGGGVWTFDSPRMQFATVEALEAAGVVTMIEEYFGERPAVSINKSTLRRVPADAINGAWHQDGAFLGPGIRTVNAWLSLTTCGVTAPGMDLVPKRMPLAPTGTEGSYFPWAVADDLIDELAAPVEVIRPEFRPGDIVLFDHFFLHRTGAGSEAMVNERYAIETWFFAPSCYPDTQQPIVL